MTLSGLVPISIRISNAGVSTRGGIELHLDDVSSDRVYYYPMDLPSGSVKQIIAYPDIAGFASSLDIDFDGNPTSASAQLTLGGNSRNNDIQVGYVGDSVGALQSIRNLNEYEVQSGIVSYNDCYCSPETAPDRSTGYSTLAVLVLGDGAERLSDDQWNAIRNWVVSGGSVLMLGGAGSLAYLDTAGASAISPVDNLQQGTAALLKLPGLFGAMTYHAVSVLSGRKKAGAYVLKDSTGKPFIFCQGYGAGMVSVTAFDPTAQPMRGVDGAPVLLKQLLQTSRTIVNMSQLAGRQYPQGAGEDEFSRSNSANPFKVSLPPVTEVAAIFAAYFVLTIPLTFLILRRLGRLGLTWITTPALSIIFAALFYLFTAGLYSAGLTRRTGGVLTACSGGRSAHFDGDSEIFFPRGGAYDIRIPNAESLEETSADADSDGYQERNNADMLNTTDGINGVEADNYGVSNLAFRRFYYSQPVDMGSGIRALLQRTDEGLHADMVNGSQFSLGNVTVVCVRDRSTYNLGALPAGGTISGNYQPQPDMTQVIPTFLSGPGGMPSGLVNDIDGAYITGTVSSPAVGPQMGKNVSQPDAVRFFMSAPVAFSRGAE